LIVLIANRKKKKIKIFYRGWNLSQALCHGGGGGGEQLDASSRLDVVEIARVPDVLPSLFPSWSG